MRKPEFGKRLSVLHAVLTVAAAVTILVLSVMPKLSLSSGMPINSGLVPHISAYATLCFLTCIWLHVAGITQFPILSAFLCSSLYGLLIEFVQFCVLYRSFEMGDILINCFASAIAIIPCYVMIRYVPVYKKQLG